ncbi:hypothetical protein D3C87_686480 [compost metagenome]
MNTTNNADVKKENNNVAIVFKQYNPEINKMELAVKHMAKDVFYDEIRESVRASLEIEGVRISDSQWKAIASASAFMNISGGA